MSVSCAKSEPPPSPKRTLSEGTFCPVCCLRRPEFVWVLASYWGVAGVAGCGSGQTGSDRCPAWTGDVNVVTWWVAPEATTCSPGEGCASQRLADGYESCGDGTSVVTFVNPGGRTLALEAVQNQDSGDIAIVNGRSDVFRMAACDGNSEPSVLDLGTFDNSVAPFVVDRLPEQLRPLVSCPDGRVFGVVLGLHSLNQLFYNRTLIERPDVQREFAERGIDFGSSLGIRQLPVILEALVAAGIATKPLVIEGDPGTWSRFLIENVMVALAQTDPFDNDGYTGFWGGLVPGNHDPEKRINLNLFKEALEFIGQIAPYIGSSSNALDDVNAGRAVFTVTGDWEKPNYPSLGTRRFFGTEGVYVYTSDVAVAMRSRGSAFTIDQTAPALGAMKAVTSAEVQAPFSREKNTVQVVTTRDGVTVAKAADELFVVDGVRLIGIPGLPSYVPYRSFDSLETKIADYMQCLVDDGALGSERESDDTLVSSAPAAAGGVSVGRCSGPNDELVDYVRDEYCRVISDTGEGCSDVPPRKPARVR